MITARLLASAFGRRFAAGLFAGLVLLGIVDFAESARYLTDVDDALTLAVALYVYKAPTLLLQALPLALLFGVLLTLADLGRSGQLLALRAAGAGPVRLTAPALAVAAVLSVAAVPLADEVAPRAMRRAVEIEVHDLDRPKGGSFAFFHRQRSWFASPEGALYRVGGSAADGRRLTDVSRYTFEDGRFTGLGVAEALRYQDGAWRGEDSWVWRLPEDPASLELTRTAVPVEAAPAHFARIVGQPHELPGTRLREAIALARAQGRDTVPLEVEAHGRLTMPLLGLALAILGLGVGLGLRTPKTLVEAAGMGIAVAFGGWILLAVSRALGLAGIVGPGVSAWLPAVVPAALGVLLLSRQR